MPDKLFDITPEMRARLAERLLTVIDHGIATVAALMGGAPVADVPRPQDGVCPELLTALSHLVEVGDLHRGSVVYASGPLPAGTVLREDPPEDRRAARLRIPALPGPTFGFFIDDQPGFRWEHDCRLAWVNVRTGLYSITKAQERPVVVRPDGIERPFVLRDGVRVGGVPVVIVEGERPPHPAGDADKPVDEAELRDGVPVETGRPCTTVPREPRDPPGEPETPPEEPEVPPDDPVESPEHRDPPCRPCSKRALSCDLGDKADGCIGDNMEEDAAAVAKWLEGEGFTVSRRSQETGNGLPGFTGNLGNALVAAIQGEGAVLTAAEAALGNHACCCHEFFLYLAGHGNANGVTVYPYRRGDSRSFVDWASIIGAITGSFPANTHVYIFVDACKSGGLITFINGAGGAAFRARFARCGYTILTVTDSAHNAAGGQGIDSGTEDFMEGADVDNDGDGTKGTLRDRFKEMEDQGGGYEPQGVQQGTGSLGPLK
ncbi:MAG: hypothetical protein ABIO70_05515 [Pseudomonadota bacterium]